MPDYTLTNQNIDMACHAVEIFFERAHGEKRDVLRIRLMAEETLLKYQKAFGTKGTFQFQCKKRMGRLQAGFSIPGERNDVIHMDGEEESAVMKGILSGMGEIPAWQYKNGVNYLAFTLKKKKASPAVSLLAAVALALFCGMLSRFLPEKNINFLSEKMITPVLDTFMGLLTAVAGPMIFLSVAGGIYNIGDTATLGKIGKRMISRFLWMTLLLTVVFGIAILPLFPLAGRGGSSFRLSELLEMVLGMVPDSFLAPFSEGNPLQIIFLAVLIGLAMLILGSRAAVVSSFLDQANAVILLLMENISAFVPVFIFGSLFHMILGNNFSVLLKAYKVLPVMLLGDVFLMVVYACLVCIRKKVSPAVFLKKIAPVFLIGLTTASSAAAFLENRNVCEEKLGIDKKIVNIGVPLGQVVFMPGFSILYFVMGICMAEIYDVKISPVWLVTALLIAVVLAVATPPIPGGALACYTILLLQLEIPAQAIAVAVAINVILDFFATAVDLFCLEAELTELAGELGMLDVEKMREKF